MVAATLLALSGATVPALAADPTPTPKKLFTIDDSRIDESSGLAKSVKHPGIWWTTNDSGDSGRIFGVNKFGKVEAVLTFGAPVRDVEALGISKDGRLYIADIGDNRETRDEVYVYSIAEPENLESQAVRFRRYDFQYPDGPHDAETLMVHPENGRLYIVTKEDEKGGLYAAPEEPSREGVNKLKRVGDMPALVTDGTFMPDALRIVVRGYLSMTAMSWAAPKAYANISLPISQGESIAVGPTDSSVVIGSEGRSSAVYQVQVPVRKAAAKPTPTPTATDTDANTPAKGGGTLRYILLGAGVFAVLVALVTFPAGRRERLDAMVENQRIADRQRAERQRRRSTV